MSKAPSLISIERQALAIAKAARELRQGSKASTFRQPDVMDQDEAAETLGVHVDIARGLVRCGAIDGYRSAYRFYLYRHSIAGYMAAAKRPGFEPPDPLLNVHEAAAYLATARTTLGYHIRAGRISTTMTKHRERLISLAELHRFNQQYRGNPRDTR